MKEIFLYHGSNKKFSKFDYKFIGDGNDQEGVGFYLTSDVNDAAAYGRYIYKVRFKYRILVQLDRFAPEAHIAFLLRAAPHLRETLTNWGENPMGAYHDAKKAMIEYGVNAHQQYLNVWWDFYRDKPVEYLKNMVKLGYDGILIPRSGGIMHVVAFDPEKIEIIDVITIQKERKYYKRKKK